MSKWAVIVIVAALLALVGCENQKSGQRLGDVAVEHARQQQEISRIAKRVEGINSRLEQLRQSIEKIAPPSGAPEPPKSSEPRVVEFKDTPEYKQIAARLSSIQQQMNLFGSGLAKTEDELARKRQQAQLRDPRQAMRAMSNPQEFSNRLDTLVQNFAQKIQDPVRRQQFEADVKQLKRNLSERPTTQELYDQVLASLRERLNNEQDDRAREFVQREVRSLESASGDELAGRLERYQRMQTFRQLRDLTREYDIPRDTLRDSGLPAMGRGFGPSRGGRGRGARRGG